MYNNLLAVLVQIFPFFFLLFWIVVIVGIVLLVLHFNKKNKSHQSLTNIHLPISSMKPQLIGELTVRKANHNDLCDLLSLYTQLHNNPLPPINNDLCIKWDSIIEDKNHHIVVGCVDGSIVCSCVIVIIPNLTNGQKPYSLIENVVTDTNYRNKGYATAVLNYAKQIAISQNCYKIMLMTSSKEESTLNFYKKAGYNCEEKTAFIQRL